MKRRLFYILTTLIISLLSITQAEGAIPNNEIRYTTTNGRIVTLKNANAFGEARIISNTYSEIGGCIKLDRDATTINNEAFLDCSTLATMSIPNTVTHIGKWAFAACYSITDIFVLWDTPLEVKEDIFRSCLSKTATLHCPEHGIKQYQKANEWKQFTKYIAINDVPANEIRYKTSNGKIINPYCEDFGGANIVSNTYANGVGIMKFDKDVTRIGWFTFLCCFKLISIKIPSTVTFLAGESFAHCENLAEIIISYENPIYDSRNDCNCVIETATNTLLVGTVKSVIPDNVTTIGEFAFFGREKMSKITIPSSVKNISFYAFNKCLPLSDIYISNQDPPKITDDAFKGVDLRKSKLHCPIGTSELYKKTRIWKKFKKIDEKH